jgi:[glutamine synthetase] adenylyltransferase / [glutamine synthetase]-adenylyl-L-tyrosine phosphorylase
MRQRLRDAHPCPEGHFDLKHSEGGMIDLEFAVQYLILAHSHAHPELLDNKGNIALLQRAQDAGLLPAPVGADAALAYRALRAAQHHARLDEASTSLAPEAWLPLAAHREAVLALWRHTFAQA